MLYFYPPKSKKESRVQPVGKNQQEYILQYEGQYYIPSPTLTDCSFATDCEPIKLFRNLVELNEEGVY